jgi:hypothetical protein
MAVFCLSGGAVGQGREVRGTQTGQLAHRQARLAMKMNSFGLLLIKT